MDIFLVKCVSMLLSNNSFFFRVLEVSEYWVVRLSTVTANVTTETNNLKCIELTIILKCIAEKLIKNYILFKYKCYLLLKNK